MVNEQKSEINEKESEKMKNTETWEGQGQGEASTTLSLEASRGWMWGTVPFYSLLRLPAPE